MIATLLLWTSRQAVVLRIGDDATASPNTQDLRGRLPFLFRIAMPLRIIIKEESIHLPSGVAPEGRELCGARAMESPHSLLGVDRAMQERLGLSRRQGHGRSPNLYSCSGGIFVAMLGMTSVSASFRILKLSEENGPAVVGLRIGHGRWSCARSMGGRIVEKAARKETNARRGSSRGKVGVTNAAGRAQCSERRTFFSGEKPQVRSTSSRPHRVRRSSESADATARPRAPRARFAPAQPEVG